MWSFALKKRDKRVLSRLWEARQICSRSCLWWSALQQHCECWGGSRSSSGLQPDHYLWFSVIKTMQSFFHSASQQLLRFPCRVPGKQIERCSGAPWESREQRNWLHSMCLWISWLPSTCHLLSILKQLCFFVILLECSSYCLCLLQFYLLLLCSSDTPCPGLGHITKDWVTFKY